MKITLVYLCVLCGQQNVTRLCRVNLRVDTQCDSQKTIVRYLLGRAVKTTAVGLG
jgi:hypothetical protein